jgi:CheY-like chemotaxis protein
VFSGVHSRRGDGWEFVEKLRSANPSIPLMVLSNSVSKVAEEKGESLGCAGFVYKGLKPEVLLQKVLDVCSKHAPLSGEGLKATKGRILVVDDEDVIRTVLARFLKGKGYDVVTAANGKEALERVKRERPHLMLLDIRMPEMDGFEVLRRVHDIDREIAVMMITANMDVDQARQTIEMGACDYIVKPFHLDYLETTVMAKLLLVTA